MIDGILIVNKPSGITSHDVVAFVRRKLGIKKVGHAGTLDPIATGVLVVLIGRCTRMFDSFLRMDKEYVATLTLGVKTASGDSQGEVLAEADYRHISREMVEAAFCRYSGEIMQVPPMYSAVKHKGKRLYKLALKGQQVERTPRKVTIRELRMLSFEPPHVRFYLRCSRGTYVRQLAEDVAADLRCVGHISQLERQSIGPFHIRESLRMEEIEPARVRPSYSFLIQL